jgi:N utilization substance protein A
VSSDFVNAIQELAKEKGIDPEVLFKAVEDALVVAYKKNFDSTQTVRIELDKNKGDFHVFEQRTVVDEVVNPHDQIALADAQKINPDYQLEDIMEQEVFPRDFSRIAVQNAKQIIMQRIREAERGIVYDEYSGREEDIVTGIIQRSERGTVFIDLGKVEAILAQNEQIPGEIYRYHDRMKFYIIEVKKTSKGPQILVSRTHPGLLKRLFELEVPEIHDGLVEIKSVAREAGMRSKIAVYTKDDKIDPVGACVGHKGMRVQNIVNELRGEKIDIVRYSENPDEFVANALSPAKVVSTTTNLEEKICRVIVPDYQLSLAIGKEGQNARLAAKLTGWKIDIKSESQADETAHEGETAAEPSPEDAAPAQEPAAESAKQEAPVAEPEPEVKAEVKVKKPRKAKKAKAQAETPAEIQGGEIK